MSTRMLRYRVFRAFALLLVFKIWFYISILNIKKVVFFSDAKTTPLPGNLTRTLNKLWNRLQQLRSRRILNEAAWHLNDSEKVRSPESVSQTWLKTKEERLRKLLPQNIIRNMPKNPLKVRKWWASKSNSDSDHDKPIVSIKVTKKSKINQARSFFCKLTPFLDCWMPSKLWTDIIVD